MKIEQQVCSLDHARKLKELGITQQSEYYFRDIHLWNINEITDWQNQETMGNLIQGGDEAYRIFSAFTVAELGVMLPDVVKYFRANDILDQHAIAMGAAGSTEAEARAAMLIHLIENKLTTVDEVNQKLTK